LGGTVAEGDKPTQVNSRLDVFDGEPAAATTYLDLSRDVASLGRFATGGAEWRDINTSNALTLMTFADGCLDGGAVWVLVAGCTFS
jgi:hypothetical protein